MERKESTLIGLKRIVLVGLKLALPCLFGILSVKAFGARDATVAQDKAIIWADAQRTSPLGYVRRGKVLRVGDKEREKGQVVPVVVSGRIGYVAIDDLNFNQDDIKKIDDEEATTRFKQATMKRYGEQIMMGYTQFSSTESKDSAADRPGDTWNFSGGYIKGEIRTENERIGVLVYGEYLFAENTSEKFRMFNTGLGVSLSLINTRRFKIKGEGIGLIVPWAQYESAPLFTLNGYGFGAIGQGTVSIYVTDSVGLEFSAGVESIKIFKIKRPSPFKEFNPFFNGTRMAGGLVIRF